MNNVNFLYLSLEEVVALGGYDMQLAVNDIERVVSLHDNNEAVVPSKVVLKQGADENFYGRINGMPGYIGGEYNMMGIKWIGSNPDNPFKYDLPRASALTILNDPVKKIPVAVMDGTVISAVRTGAVTGVAAKYLSREDSETLLLIGAGVQSRTQLKAIVTVRPDIKKIYIYDLRFERSQVFAQEMAAEINKEIIPVTLAEEYAKQADILVTATVAENPIVHSGWLKQGSLYCHVGGNECTYNTVKSVDKRIVDNWSEVKHRDGSTIAKMGNMGLLPDDEIYAELGEIVNKKKPGRSSSLEKIYFNSVGMGIEDIAIATRVYKTAVERKVGISLPLWNKPLFV